MITVPQRPGFGRVFCFCVLLPALSSVHAEEEHVPTTLDAALSAGGSAPLELAPGAEPEAPPLPPPPAPDVEVQPAWPAAPAPAHGVRWDWVQTTSGEWLKGRIRTMRDGVLEFDSDEFGLQDIDWEDVAGIRSARVMDVFFDETSMERGYLHMEDGLLVIAGKERTLRIPPANVFSVGAGTQNEKDYWSADVSLSSSFRSGTVNQTDINVTAELRRRTARSSTEFSYRGNLSRLDGVENANDHRVNLNADRLLSRTWFVRPLALEFFKDDMQNIREQWTLGVGGGYYFFNDARTRWEVSGGPAYLLTEYRTVQAGEDLIEKTPAFVLGTDLEHELHKNIDLEAAWRITFVNEAAGSVLQTLETAVDIDLTALLDLRVAFTVDRVQSPQADANGNTPEQNDARLTVGLEYEF